MAPEKILILSTDPNLGSMLDNEVLQPAGYSVTYFREASTGLELLDRMSVDLVILDAGDPPLELAETTFWLQEKFPGLPIILVVEDKVQFANLFQEGFSGFLCKPLESHEVLQTLQRVLVRSQKIKDWAGQESSQRLRTLQRRLDGLEALTRVGKSITGLLNLDELLAAVVDASVELTGAEESSLLLLDESSGELYVRAARNFQDDFVRSFRLPIQNSLAGQVMRTGKPLVVNSNLPQKIKTSYLVYTLIYVPLRLANRVIGVLGVDNRQSGHPFQQEHLDLISVLADYAASAISNARVFSAVQQEKKKFESILTKMEDGVIVLDHQGRVVLVNEKACDLFGIEAQKNEGKSAVDVFAQEELLQAIREDANLECCVEISLEDGRYFNIQARLIPEIGKVISLQDITNLKELSRIKSDFVSIVSHDLRSPLTSILGYVDLLARVGPVTSLQQEFIQRVRVSVKSITDLINDLLNLSRIEAGFDMHKEPVVVDALLTSIVDSMRDVFNQKQQSLQLDIAPGLPSILGNPVQLNQLFGNLIENAHKYTPESGVIQVRAYLEGEQVIIQVQDNGLGIPRTDHPYIFDKFYRASNVFQDIPGTGLGLAIAKSIVDDHEGRIWVDSVIDQGTTFTLVLPVLSKSYTGKEN